jgi:hypothetical protein
MANISIGATYADAGSAKARGPRPGFFRRVFVAIMEARQLQADRKVAEIMARHGGLPAHAQIQRRALARRDYPFGRTW